MTKTRMTAPPNLIETNVNDFEGDLLLSCTYSPSILPNQFKELAKGRNSYSFCPELTHLDKLGFKLCTIFRLKRVNSLTVLTKDGSPHSMQIPLMVQEAAEDVGFDKQNIKYYCIEKGKLHEFHDMAVRKARHFSAIENIMPFAKIAKVAKVLRGENGCPTDRKENFTSIIGHLREEVEEVAQALSIEDMTNFKEELGDVLFNVFLMAQIAAEHGKFTISDVASHVADKMINNHPKVFNTQVLKY